MPKAEAKNAVKFTRMCKFWKTNECKMGADCTFAHATSELRPSPKPCFDFVKNGFCARGQGCRFVHEVVEMTTTDKFVEVQHSTVNRGETAIAPVLATYSMPPSISAQVHMAAQLTAAQQMQQFSGTPPGPVCAQTNPRMLGLGALMEPSARPKPNPCLRPPPGLECFVPAVPAVPAPPGLLVVPEVTAPKTGLQRTADSRRSSLNDISLGLECVKLPISKADMEGADDATVATQSFTSTMCLSTTPSSFSEVESPSKPTSFWL
ncbi:unnamed protein product [Symbiodinium sp. CCMP2456]|nr:unnamed protein product [Symbiodinium sp. CCMP2456]